VEVHLETENTTAMDLRYRIRRAVLADAKVIARHRTAMFCDRSEVVGDDIARLESASFVFLRQMMAERRYLGWLTERADEVVAGGGLVVSQILPRPGIVEGGAQALIVNMYCEPAHRRRGLARGLMEAMLDWCKQERIARVTLHTSDAGRPLYESLGFIHTNEMRWQTNEMRWRNALDG
jgi:GNAT superfamily N-acetyltransferase